MMTRRFAPSPTGYLHVGNAIIAILNGIFAKRENTDYILRFDDTDTERSQAKYKSVMQEDLEWLGLQFNKTYQQSDQDYSKEIEQLKHTGHLYECYETKEELDAQRTQQRLRGEPPIYRPIASTDKTRTPHWRFKLSAEKEKWHDRGLGEYDATYQASDPVVVREDGVVLYTLASVIDDVRDRVKGILRGEDHVPNTFIQRQIFRALGTDPDTIEWTHIKLLKGQDGKNLSKRDGESSSIQGLRARGYSALAIWHTLLVPTDDFYLSTESLFDSYMDIWLSNPLPWSENRCKEWQKRVYRHMSPTKGKEMLEGYSWQIDQEHWGTISTMIDNRDSIIYLREVFCSDTFWCDPTSSVQKMVRRLAVGMKSCDPYEIQKEAPQLTIKEIGSALRYAITGKTYGPPLQELRDIIGWDRISLRLRESRAQSAT